ncbi:MAG: hypothetical protein ACR2PY_01040, partial [Salinispira sp.]
MSVRNNGNRGRVRQLRQTLHLRQVLRFFLLWGLIILLLSPVIMVLLGSFKSRGAAAHFTLALPNPWMIDAYAHVITVSPFFRSFFNSVFLTVISTAAVLVIAAPAAFVIARRNTRAVRG